MYSPTPDPLPATWEPPALRTDEKGLEHDSEAGKPAQLILYPLFVSCQVTFPLDFCAFGWEANGWAALRSLI